MALNVNINLNDYVWVELTNYGWDCIRDYFANLFSNVPTYSQEVAEKSVNMYRKETKQYWVDGVGKNEIALTRFQLHDLMHLLGPKTYMGNETCINNNTVYFTIDNFIEKLPEKYTEDCFEIKKNG